MKRLTSFFSMKKLLLGALACAALVLMMPGEAKAAEQHVRNGVLTFNGTEDSVDRLDSEGYKWEKGSGSTWHKLTLKNIKITVNGDTNAVIVPGGTTIELIGDNEIASTWAGDGIDAAGDLTITGGGKLEITVENGYGIYSQGNITIDGATIKITDNAAHGYSKIYAQDHNISIINSNVTIIGKSNTDWGHGNGLDTNSSGEIRINNSELYIKIESTGSHHCLEPGKDGDLNRKLFIEPAANLKVTYTQDSDPITIKDPITVSQKNILCADGTKEVRITYGRSSTPGTPSDNKSDDKKNESSPFHKFETGSIKEAKASGTIDATGGWKSFDRGTLNELAKLGKDITVTYEFNGHTYCVVVPKGFDPQKLVNEEGYCGFLYLAKVYGAVMIK